MYKIDTNLDSESRGANFLDVGIHEDVELIDIAFNVSSEGNEFLVFTFSKDNKLLKHTEWRPKDEDPEKLESKIMNQAKRFKHIATKFIPEDRYQLQVEDFKGLCDSTIRLLGTEYKGKKVRTKVVYSNSNYTSLPNYRPFIENMEVPKAESKLEILSIDKMVKDRPDQESVTKNPLADVPTTAENPMGLPF